MTFVADIVKYKGQMKESFKNNIVIISFSSHKTQHKNRLHFNLSSDIFFLLLPVVLGKHSRKQSSQLICFYMTGL